MAGQPNNEARLPPLNALFASLALPLSLETVLDLTPSLILATFESMLRTRLSIPPYVRKSKTREARIEAMKIFLGVLSDDVLGVGNSGVDGGVSAVLAVVEVVDPRRLADGCTEELEWVADVLCWIGKRMGYISQEGEFVCENVASRDDPTVDEAHPDVDSPSTSMRSSATVDMTVDSISRISEWSSDADAESDDQTTIMGDNSFVLDLTSQVDETDETDEVSLTSERSSTHSGMMDHHPVHTPRCIHEVEFHSSSSRSGRRQPLRDQIEDMNSVADTSVASSYCDCPTGASEHSMKSVRQDGWINAVDFDDELSSFEGTQRKSRGSTASRSYNHQSSYVNTTSHTPPINSRLQRPITRHISPSQHAVALLEEKARLLEELALLKSHRSWH